ncbi:helix-turn-helix domain-containing protein [Sphaerochaeta pleomorpha]
MLITTADAAKRLGVNRRTVLLWIQTRGIPAYRFSGCWRIDNNNLEK